MGGLRAAWVVLPLALGPAVAEALHDLSPGPRSTASTALDAHGQIQMMNAQSSSSVRTEPKRLRTRPPGPALIQISGPNGRLLNYHANLTTG